MQRQQQQQPLQPQAERQPLSVPLQRHWPQRVVQTIARPRRPRRRRSDAGASEPGPGPCPSPSDFCCVAARGRKDGRTLFNTSGQRSAHTFPHRPLHTLGTLWRRVHAAKQRRAPRKQALTQVSSLLSAWLPGRVDPAGCALVQQHSTYRT
jgi:hypothetical protein